jgi:hypothetical protein
MKRVMQKSVDGVEGCLLDLECHFYGLMMRRQDKEWAI